MLMKMQISTWAGVEEWGWGVCVCRTKKEVKELDGGESTLQKEALTLREKGILPTESGGGGGGISV